MRYTQITEDQVSQMLGAIGAESVARRIRTGQVNVNGFMLEPCAPFGGFKESGLGREGGPEGLGAYLEDKAINSFHEGEGEVVAMGA